jgi:hypothetical protein
VLVLGQAYGELPDCANPSRRSSRGGMATHSYTGARVTTDVYAEFSMRILLPSERIVETQGGNTLYLDSN